MLRWFSSRLVWGAILVLGGIALLLQNLNLLPSAGSLFWTGIFLLGGIAFLAVYFENRKQWWVFIPGFTLLGLSASSLVGILLPSLENMMGGLMFFLGISVGFIAVLIVDRQQWWAIIPAGVLLTLGIVSFVDQLESGINTGALFFLGVGLTFAILALAPGYGTTLRWAYIPAGILIVIGVFMSALSSNWMSLAFPVLLILIGIFLVIRNLIANKI